MKRNILLLFIMGILAKPMYSTAQMTPVEFNDHIFSISDSLSTMAHEWSGLLGMAVKTKDFALLRPNREALEEYINTCIIEMTNMKEVSNSKDLRMAMLGFLRFEKDLVTKGFSPIDKLPASTTNEEAQMEFKKITDMAKGESVELEKVRLAQEAYASSNHFNIKTKE